MDKTAKEFLEYLMYIGFINKDSITFFLECMQESTKDLSIGIKKIIIQTLFNYISNIQEKNLNDICLSVVNKFFQNKIKANIPLLKNLFNIYSKNHNFYLKKCFNFWKKETFQDFDLSIKNYKKTENNSSHYSSTLYQEFINRQREYSRSAAKKREKLFKLNEDYLNSVYTFKPSMKKNKNKSFNNSNIFEKLYEDSTRRKRENSKKLNEIMMQIKTDSNFIYNKNREGNFKIKKNFDKDTIERLYNNYKLNKIKNKELEERINIENGYTFKPTITKKKFKSNNKNNNTYNYNNIFIQ